MTVTIVGIGLIGGSMALALKQKGIATKIIGIDNSVNNLAKALELNIIDESLPLKEAVEKSDLIFVSIPVDATIDLVKNILDIIADAKISEGGSPPRVAHPLNKNNANKIIIDVGSTKFALCDAIKNHPMRKQFVATHPMWGTEYSGPEAAVVNAFVGRACVICDKELSDNAVAEQVENIYKTLGMHIIYMDALNHDVHAAYVSHISHITSFALANTVLEKEKEEDAIFEMAGGGFESTVRLAKSNSAMWAPIFMQNKDNVLDVLNEHIYQLRKFKASLEKENMEYLVELMENANKIKRIIK
jgi:prephenate dehydrogenase